MKKRILILTAGFGEGHNSAARGVRDGLARVASDQTTVELRDLFAEAYGPINELVRRSYLALVNSAPRAWGFVYRWLDRKTDYNTEFRRLIRLKAQFAPVLDRFQPDIVVCSFPAYANVLQDILGAGESANVWWLSRTRSLSTHPGTGARQIISSLRTNKAPACYGAAELRRKKSRYLVFLSVPNSQISPQIGHCLPAIPAGGFCT